MSAGEDARLRPIVNRGEYLERLSAVLGTEVGGLSAEDRAASARAAADVLATHGRPASVRLVRPVRGRRPPDEATSPGLGASDSAILLLEGRGDNRAHLLYELDAGEGLGVFATLRFLGPWGAGNTVVPGWDGRPVAGMAFTLDDRGDRVLRPARPGDRRLVLELRPESDLLPGARWRWEDLDPEFRLASTGERDPFGFGHLFAQQLSIELELRDGDRPVAGSATKLLVVDVRRLGSFYERLVRDLLAPDAARQAAAASSADPGPAYHPWFPVLRIGGEKAALYTRALIGDLVEKECHLTNPAWLLHVGLYLEWLTCMGVVEAVRPDVGDLLTPSERAAFNGSDTFREIRQRIDPARWVTVWQRREIAFPRLGTPRAGPVSALNLRHKESATLAFLHAHHDDLKHAIELAGPNLDNAQETWGRVFRDAERAVLRQTAAAFPELGYLPTQARKLILHHRQGRISGLRAPHALTALVADRDGLFASACAQYRASMNVVAKWAKQRGLMDYTGTECVTRHASLLDAHDDEPERVAALQRGDGFNESLVITEAEPAHAPPIEDAVKLLGQVPIFAMLAGDQLHALAATARPLALAPLERFVVQGQPGDSLFVVADGEIEVILRRDGGEDLRVGVMERGAIVGEMALITGEPRAATLRARDGALIYEVGTNQYMPLLKAHPEWIPELAAIMERRLAENREALNAYDERKARAHIARLIRRRLTAPAGRVTRL